MATRALKPTEFASLVNAITSAFGDPTRRKIYLMVRDHDDGLTTKDVAEATGLHTNVARHHLEKLANGGYLEVGYRERTGAGRPAKTYQVTVPELHLEFDVGHDDILITLLGRALSKLPRSEAEELAEEVGEEFGRKMAATLGDSGASQRSFRSALHVVADALSAHGFAAHTERHQGSAGSGPDAENVHLATDHCPFGEVAIDHPVICAVDRGMVKGLLGSLYGATAVQLNSSMAQGDSACVAEVSTIEVPTGS